MQAKRLHGILGLILIVALLLGGLSPAGLLAQIADEPPPPHGIRYDAPEYAIDGPYAVGVRYFTIPAETEIDRELTASVWYPALNPDGEAGEIVYDLQFEPGNIPPFSVFGHAILDAEPDDSGGPYPLVVYTHAHWSMAQEVPYFTEHLASRGFVVIAVDHEDNWSTDLGPLDFEAVIRRPQEVTRQIDYAEQLSAADGDLPDMISTQKVGVAGWSMGGGTSLAVAGARLDLATLRAWCDADPLHAQTASWACVDVLENEAAMAEFAGLDEIPSGLWPTTKDERIAAAVRLSGSMVWYGSEGLASVDVPVLLMHGGGEAITDPGILMGAPYASVGSERKAEVVFDYAGHTVFFSSCADSPILAAIGFPMFCSDQVWDMDRGHDLINHFATAFLEAELKGDENAAAALAMEQVSFPGVEYREQGYGPEAESMNNSNPAEANKTLIARLGHAFNVGELDIIDEIVAPDFVLHNPLVPEGVHGPDGLKAFFASTIAAMPDVYHPTEHLIGEGDLVAIHLPLSGTFENEMNGIPPNGKPVRAAFFNIWRVVDGQIVEAWFSFDTFGYLQQLGAMPAEEAEARQLTDEEMTNLAAYARLAEEVYNRADKDEIRELYAPDFIAYMPGDLILYGHDGVDLFVDVTHGAFPDMHWVIDEMTPAGDTVVARVTGYGTFTNAYMDIPPNGNRIKWPLTVIWRFVDGKAVEVRGYYDQLAFMQQLGAIPATSFVVDPAVTRDVTRRIVESWNAETRNFEEIKEEIISPAWALHPHGQPDAVELYGRAGFSAWITSFVTSFPDLTYTIDEMIVEGEWAVVRWTGNSTHTVEFMGIPPTGKPVVVNGTNLYRVVDGQNTDIWYTFDTLSFMQQLGIVPIAE